MAAIDPIATGSALQPAAGAARPRLLALDMLRGIAALAIVLRHFAWRNDDVPILPSSYLAVDLFFMLSGFVLSYTYEDRLRAGMPPREFFVQRIFRLYPLYLVGLVLGSIGAVLLLTLGGVAYNGLDTLTKWAGSTVFGLVMLPTPGPFTDGVRLFPLNVPSWSLFSELVINLLFARFALRLDFRRLGWIIAASFAVMALLAFRGGSVDGGGTWADLGLGLVRCSFAFFAGVVLFRLSRRFRPPVVSPLLPALLLLAPMALPAGIDPLWTLASVVVIFPAVIWLACAPRGRTRSDPLFKFLGDLSYPIYVMQAPVILLCTLTLWLAAGERFGDHLARDLPIYLGATIATGYACGRWLDGPMRKWMRTLSARELPGLASRRPPTTTSQASR